MNTIASEIFCIEEEVSYDDSIVKAEDDLVHQKLSPRAEKRVRCTTQTSSLHHL